MLVSRDKINEFVKRCVVASLRPVAELQHKLPQGVYLVILATLVGTLTGSLAALLKWLIDSVARIVTSHLHEGGANWALIIIPASGIILTACFQRYVIRHRIEHGTEQLKDDLVRRDYWLETDLLYAPVAASTITLGLGGSAGSEGPIAYTGAAIGSNFARACGFSGPMSMALLAAGAGAGIAGIFKSPVGGAMFSLEVLRVEMATTSVMLLFVACIVSALVAYLWSGCTPDVHFIPTDVFDPSIIPPMIILGIFCGLYGTYYAFAASRTRKWLDSIRHLWTKNVLAALCLGCLVFLFPVLYGEGYGVMSDLVNNHSAGLGTYSLLGAAVGHQWGVLLIVAGVLLVKAVAATLTNSGGGVAGDFAPTFFAGAMAGFFFAEAANLCFGLQLDTGTFALAGMSGTMAAVLRAPLMAIFLTAEMTWNYEFFLPLALSAIVAYFTTNMIRRKTF